VRVEIGQLGLEPFPPRQRLRIVASFARHAAIVRSRSYWLAVRRPDWLVSDPRIAEPMHLGRHAGWGDPLLAITTCAALIPPKNMIDGETRVMTKGSRIRLPGRGVTMSVSVDSNDILEQRTRGPAWRSR
jgi:hypothetical protein